jgi:hypothetical protein
MYFNFRLTAIILLFSITACQRPETLNDYFQELSAEGRFNGNVLVVQHDTVRFQKSYGYANHTKSDSLTRDHLFAIGSIQKEFPAVTLMHLEEKGLVSLDDPISSYLNGLPAWSDRITVRHLLQYSSGLPTVDWEKYFGEGPPNEERVLEDLASLKELAFAPGRDYLYSNYNNFLQVRIIEAVAQTNFDTYFNQEILRDAGIEGILLKPGFPFSGQEPFAMPFNDAFEPDDLQYALETAVATTEGLYHWFKAVDNYKILSEESVRKLSREAIEGDNIQAPLGRADWENDSLKLHLHHGSSHNYEALVRHHVTEDLYIILLTNRKKSNLHEIADTLYDILIEKD